MLHCILGASESSLSLQGPKVQKLERNGTLQFFPGVQCFHSVQAFVVLAISDIQKNGFIDW